MPLEIRRASPAYLTTFMQLQLTAPTSLQVWRYRFNVRLTWQLTNRNEVAFGANDLMYSAAYVSYCSTIIIIRRGTVMMHIKGQTEVMMDYIFLSCWWSPAREQVDSPILTSKHQTKKSLMEAEGFRYFGQAHFPQPTKAEFRATSVWHKWSTDQNILALLSQKSMNIGVSNPKRGAGGAASRQSKLQFCCWGWGKHNSSYSCQAAFHQGQVKIRLFEKGLLCKVLPTPQIELAIINRIAHCLIAAQGWCWWCFYFNYLTCVTHEKGWQKPLASYLQVCQLGFSQLWTHCLVLPHNLDAREGRHAEVSVERSTRDESGWSGGN